MGDVSSGAKMWLQCGFVLSWPTMRAFRFFFSLTLVAAVFLAATNLPARAAVIHSEAATEQTPNYLDNNAPCEEEFVCSAYIFSEWFGDGFSDAEYPIFLISLEMPLRNFSTPKVDLPPPRTAA